MPPSNRWLNRTVFGIGLASLLSDFVSSLMVGLIWTKVSPSAAFAFATIFFIAGAGIIWQMRSLTVRQA